MPTRLIIGTPTGPGMELYEIFKEPRERLFDGTYGQRMLYRGVIFAKAYKDDSPAIELRVIEFQDLDGCSPCFSKISVLEHVAGDMYRTPKPFKTYNDGMEMSTIGEVNWNTATNEFVYREIHTPLN